MFDGTDLMQERFDQERELRPLHVPGPPKLALSHFTREPLDFDEFRRYEQPSPIGRYVSPYEKPEGFWLSVDGEDDWPSWCGREDFGMQSLAYRARFRLRSGGAIRLITTHEELAAFTREYGTESSIGVMAIAWRKVARHHDGVIITPYIWSARLTYSWYYGWDCASGCIWNLEAIEQTEPSKRLDGGKDTDQ